MDYSSTFSVASEKFPGVVFTLRRMTWARRAELEVLQDSVMARMRAVQDQMVPLSKEYRAAVDAAKTTAEPLRAVVSRVEAIFASGDKYAIDTVTTEVNAVFGRLPAGVRSCEEAAAAPIGTVDFPDDKFKALVKYADQVRKIDIEELTPLAVGFAFVGFAGLVIDGEPATLDMLRQRGPDSLYEEIAAAVQHELGLTMEERENLLLPSTSAAAVDGERTPGTASLAAMPVTITIAAAASSTAPESAVASGISAAL